MLEKYFIYIKVVQNIKRKRLSSQNSHEWHSYAQVNSRRKKNVSLNLMSFSCVECNNKSLPFHLLLPLQIVSHFNFSIYIYYVQMHNKHYGSRRAKPINNLGRMGTILVPTGVVVDSYA
jgi:hypothetical protein